MKSYSKIRHIQESNKRLETRFLFEQTIGGITYSVQENPQTKKFRIFITSPKYTTPTDAKTALPSGTNWVDYDTKEAAQKVIDDMANSDTLGKPENGGKQ
jgi:hypothetical protein